MAERSRVLRAAGRDKSLAFRRQLVGREHTALVLEARDRATGRAVALTGHYVEVQIDAPDGLARRFVDVTVTEAGPERTLGRLVARHAVSA